VSELAALRAEVAELRQDVQLLTRRMLANDDRRDLARLLPAAWATFGDAAWTAADLAAAMVGGEAGPHADALLELVSEHSTEAGGLRAFGRFLARVDGVACAGLRLEHQGANGGHGAVYVVRTLRGFQAAETAMPPVAEGAVSAPSAHSTENIG
jgi:hypothetical protein